MSFADHRVLTPAGYIVAISGHQRKGGAGERLEQIAIAETVTKSPARAGIEEVIDARIKVIIAIALNGRGDKVGERRLPVRQRIESCDLASNRVDEGVGNPPVRKRLAGKGIYGHAKQTLREVTDSFRGGRYVAHARDPFACASSFVVGKEKGPVVADWPAERKAKLVAQVRRVGLVRGREEIPRIERAVAMKFKDAAVKVVRARLQYDIYLRSGAAAKGRIVGAGQIFELANRVNRRSYAESVEFRIDVVNAIQQEVVAVFARAVDAEREVSAHGTGLALRRWRRAGNQQSQFIKVAPVKGQALDLAVLDNCAMGSRVFLQGCVVSGIDFHDVRAGQDQIRVKPLFLINEDLDSLVVWPK